MATILNNQANITYDYVGSQSTIAAESNSVATTLLDEYSLTASKSPLNNSFRPGDIVTYVIQLDNNGRGDLFNLQITDNLGSASSIKPLSFLNAILYVNNTPTEISPVINPDNSVTFSIPSPFNSSSSALLIYNVSVADSVSTNITNTADVTANGGSATGTPVTVTPSPTATINIDNYAQLSVVKQGDKQTISSGETLTYTFTISNSGNEPANNVTLTDSLPQNFSISQVELISGSSTTIYQPSEYDLDTATNTITLPNATGAPISVPAAGNVLIQISGVVTA